MLRHAAPAGRLLSWSLLLSATVPVAATAQSATTPPAATQSVTPQSVTSLDGQLRELLGQSGWGDARWGALVVSLDAGDTLFAMEAADALAPASNVKLLTTAGALHVLGPEYRFRTWLLTSAPVENGVLRGDLTLYGTGDPGISDRFFGSKDEVFHRLIDQLEAAGIRRVEGDLIADASFFPGPIRHDDWDRRDLNEHFTAGVSALSFNENVVSFRIQSAEDGAAPVVETVPPHSALEIVNSAEMTTGRPRPRLAILREDPLEPVRIEGRMVVGTRDVWRQMTVAIPADFTGASFHAALIERGIEVEGVRRSVHEPAESPIRELAAPAFGRPGPRILATHESRPLSEYLAVINKQSNNLFAELVFRATGRVVEGSGSPEASARAIRSTLVQLGVDTTNLVQVDGSGLSHRNQVSPRVFVDVISEMSRGPLWSEYWASLPRAGQRRELPRMYRTAAADNLRAKSGTIEGVSALSGMVRSADGERLAFSLLVNDSPSQNRAKRAENLIGARLAEFRRAPGTAPEIVEDTPAPVRSTAFADRHLVARGENLSSIALRYGVSVESILRVNPRVEANRITAGQWLDLPRATDREPPES